MLDRLPDSETPTPLFSVIVPLEYHRGQWERSWQGWQSQTLDRTAFEIILVVPPDFPQRDKLAELASATTRLEYADVAHDIALCAVGARIARGKFLFFTESHCWPEPDVLDVCLAAFGQQDVAGFSCSSVPVCHNRLSIAEADMYEADIAYGMNSHPWRKVLDQCFVTRREAYEACGGLEPEFGHFSEWLLAARYATHGYRIGYLPEARVHHYYVGELGELKTFTLDFVSGEIGYFNRQSHEPGSELLEHPVEWVCRDNFDRDMARAIWRMSLRDAVTLSRRRRLGGVRRWMLPALFGDGMERAASAVATVTAYAATVVAMLAGSQARLGLCLKRYIAALIRYQRLTRIRADRISGTQHAAVAENATVVTQAGFYPLEHYQGSAFRWSETEAAIRICARPGRLSVRIKCLGIRSLSHQIDLRFYLDGKRIPQGAISREADGFGMQIIVPPSGTARLGWVCLPFPATGDPRRLGLPVMRLELA